jgi:hypothetical protein
VPCLLLFAVVEAHRVFSADSVVLADKGLTLVRQVGTGHGVPVRGSNWDGAWRGIVTIFESNDPRPYKNQSSVYGSLIYIVIH